MKSGSIKRPALGLRLMEARAIVELYAYAWFYPLLHLAPRGDGHPVLMTEKDAVKCRALAAPNLWRVPVSARLAPALQGAILERLGTP